jgi:hypothetical protein
LKLIHTIFGILVCAPAIWAQFGGPAILSRGEAPAAMANAEVSFRPFLQLTAIYNTDLAGVAVTPTGSVPAISSFGARLTAGVSGAHSWKRTTLGLNYRIAADHYNSNSFFDDINQSLMLSVSRQLTRHISLRLSEGAGMFSGYFALPGLGTEGLQQTVPFDPSTIFLPTTDFFRNRTYFANTMAALTIQKSTRLSFSFMGMGIFVRRRSTALYGTNGGSATGDVQYRLSARSTIGGAFSYTSFRTPGIFNTTNMYSVMATYGLRLSRVWEMSVYGGMLRSENKFIQTVPLDPVVQLLLGVREGTAVGYGVRSIPHVGGRVSRTFSRGVLYVSGGETIVPGNGLFLTSRATTGRAGYTYTGLRVWSLSAFMNYTAAKSIANVVGGYSTLAASISAGRQLVKSISLNLAVTAQSYSSGTFANYNRPIYGFSLGLGWTPGEIPLRFW